MLMPWHLQTALRALRAGGIVACPTEAVWGLSCDPLHTHALEHLLELKQRDWRKGLILVAADFGALEPYVQLPSRNALKRAQATWPGPATWVFPAAAETSLLLTGEHDTLAVRVTAHPVLRALCQAWGGALVSTSANRSGREPARSATQVHLQFGRKLDAIVPGALGGLERPTTIRHVASGMILRR